MSSNHGQFWKSAGNLLQMKRPHSVGSHVLRFIDAAAQKTLGSAGEFSWGGAASTAFWVDPAEELTACFFTQLLPSSAHPIRSELRQLVYQALT